METVEMRRYRYVYRGRDNEILFNYEKRAREENLKFEKNIVISKTG